MLHFVQLLSELSTFTGPAFDERQMTLAIAESAHLVVIIDRACPSHKMSNA
jgi:hypothetical protein